MALLLQQSSRNAGTRPMLSHCKAINNYTRRWTGVAALWLGTTTRRSEIWSGPVPRSTDAVHAQLTVALRHGVPYISVIDGLGPFATSASQRWLAKNWYTEPKKDIHPGPWGHRALAKALVHFLTQQQLRQAQLPWKDPQPALYCPRPPAYINASLLDMYLDNNPLHVSTVYAPAAAPRMVHCDGWLVTADVPGKPGLLANTVGTRCTLLAFAEEMQRHPVLVGEVHVLLLKSYEHMGRLRVTVVALPAVDAVDGSGNKTCLVGATDADGSSADNLDGGGSDASSDSGESGSRSSSSFGDIGGNVLGSKDIECLWNERVSEARVDMVPIAIPDVTNGSDVCLAFMFEVLLSNRTENKVKILALTVL